MPARAGTAPIFPDSPPHELRGGWEFARDGLLNGVATSDRPAVAPAARTPAWHWVVLVLLTLLGGFIRFAWLDRPSIWGDEAMTYLRTMDSYEQLVDMLAKTRFMPLHYEALWFLGNPSDLGHLLRLDFTAFVREQAIDPAQKRLDPFHLRLIPAVCGTLMIPAMYLLARQLLTRRAALLTAAFTACSAYLFVYSRDAKMYMPFFLAMTLNMACFLWWMRTRSSLGWLGWVASGLAALGLHMSGLGVIALQPVYLLTQRRPHWLQSIFFTLGLALIFSGPLGYYVYFNTFGEKIEDQGWGSTGISWVEERNEGHGPIELTFDSAAAFLYAWNFVPETPVSALNPKRVTAAVGVMSGFLVLCVMGALPWTAKLRGDGAGDPAAEAWWRNVLWIGLWLIVPTFGVYCLSYQRPDVVSPLTWLTDAWAWLTRPWLASDTAATPPAVGALQTRAFFIACAAVLLAALMLLWRMIPRVLAGLVAFAALVLAVVMLANGSDFSAFYGSQSAADVRLRNVTALLALILVPPLLWYFAGRTMRERAGKTLTFLLLVAALWGACFGTYLAVKPAAGSVWMPRYLAFVWPAVALAVSALVVRIPTRPLRWAAIAAVLGVNLAQCYGRVFVGNEPPLDRVVADILADDRDPATLTLTPYLLTRNQDPRIPARNLGGAPGSGTVWNHTGRYYFVYQLDTSISAREMQNWGPQRRYQLRAGRLTPQSVKSLIGREPETRRLIVWQQLPDEHTARAGDGGIRDALGPGWTLADERIYNVRFYWSWADLYSYCRREYVQGAGGM